MRVIWRSEGTAERARVPKWEIFELVCHAPGEYENPFVDVEVQAVFSDGVGEYAVDGFYDGDDVWRVRFSPMREGLWTFGTHANVAALDGLTGAFQCVAAVSRGPLALNPQFPNWFFRGDGEAQLLVNDGWFPHTANGHELPFEDLEFQQPSEADFNRYFDILAGYGVNLVVGMSQLYARQARITDPTFVWPWRVVDAERNRIDRERFNLGFYRRWEANLTHAAALDMFYAFELLYDNSVVRPREWNNHPYNVKNGGWLETDAAGDIGWAHLFDVNNAQSRKYLGRYVRYTMARLAAFRNVLWEIGGENANLAVLPPRMLPHALLPVERVAEWSAYWAEAVSRYDPYGRLRTFGDTTHHPLMVQANGNDFILTQDPRNYRRDDPLYYYRAMRDEGVRHWKYCRPMVIGEMTSSNNGNYARERRMYWIAMASGYAMGRSDRHFAPLTDGRLTESLKFGLDGVPEIYPQLKILRDFVAGRVRFWRMRPANGLVEGDRLTCALAEEGQEILIYLPFGGTVRLDVPESACALLNPRTGEIAESRAAAGRFAFTAPDDEDWVLHIRALPPRPENGRKAE